MDDYVLPGYLISGVIGVILMIIATILSATCGKELSFADSSRWVSDWNNSTACSKAKLVLFWIGFGLVVIPVILIIIGFLIGYIQFNRM